MTIAHRIYSFPTFPIQRQVFRVPGLAAVGGFTIGGVRNISPEPGGFGILEVQPSLQPGEWNYPLSSWLMSKTNGEILQMRLAPTPQVCGAQALRVGPGQLWDGGMLWSNLAPWSGDLIALYSANALQGTATVAIDMSAIGAVLQQGHVIGHQGDTYIVDEISYDSALLATVVVKPPLKRDVAAGETVYFRPFFTGYISNASEVVETYDAENNGAIQLPKIVLQQVVV